MMMMMKALPSMTAVIMMPMLMLMIVVVACGCSCGFASVAAACAVAATATAAVNDAIPCVLRSALMQVARRYSSMGVACFSFREAKYSCFDFEV